MQDTNEQYVRNKFFGNFGCQRTSAFSLDETTTLINIWADAHIQHLLLKPGNKSSIRQKVSQIMSELNYRRTAEQCREKINNLKKEYRGLKDRIRRSGEGNIRDEFPYFEALDALLGNCPSISPQNVLDTSDSHHCHQSQSSTSSPMALHEIGKNVSTTSDENTDSNDCSPQPSAGRSQVLAGSQNLGSQMSTSIQSDASGEQAKSWLSKKKDRGEKRGTGTSSSGDLESSAAKRKHKGKQGTNTSSDMESSVAKHLSIISDKMMDFMMRMEEADRRREEKASQEARQRQQFMLEALKVLSGRPSTSTISEFDSGTK